MKYVVTSKAIRPAQEVRDRCFYCDRLIGQCHEDSCILISKKVRIRAIIEYETSVPSKWTANNINFYFNEGTWCASNFINEIEKREKEYGCMCSHMVFEYMADTESATLNE